MINGSVSELQRPAAESGIYLVKVTPDGDGPVQVILPAATLTDTAGNANVASNLVVRHSDRTAPQPILQHLGLNPSRQSTIEIEVAMSEAVQGFDASSLTISSGTAEVIQNDSDQTFLVRISGMDEGTQTIELASGVVFDAAGNSNAAATPIELIVDTVGAVPTLTVSKTNTHGVYSLDIQFAENVTGLSLNDFLLSNAILSDLQGGDANYSTTLTVTSAGEFSVLLLEDSVSDGLGNRNLASNRIEGIHYGTAIILQGAGETVDLQLLPDPQLEVLQLIDARGTGDNGAILSSTRIASLLPNQSLRVIADGDDVISLDPGWQVAGVEVVDGLLERILINGEATLRLVGPLDWTNPIDAADVNYDGDVSALDALAAINALAAGTFSDEQGILRHPSAIDLSAFRFFDVNADQKLSALDALRIVNEMARRGNGSEGEASLPPDLLRSNEPNQSDDGSTAWEAVTLVDQSTPIASFGQSAAGASLGSITVDDSSTFSSETDVLDQALQHTWNWVENDDLSTI